MCKKMILFVLVAALSLSLAGCRPDSSGETLSTSPSQSGTGNQNSSPSKPNGQNTFQETILVDNEDLLFKISAIVNDPVWGYTLKAQIENRTDKDLLIALDEVSVNGYMCDPYFAATVTAGMKANKDISFSTDSFEKIGIRNVTDITFELRAYDSKNIADDEIIDEDFTIYPMGKDAAKEYLRESQEGDIVLFDNEQCTMVITGFEQDSVWGYSAHVYLRNQTDDTLMFSVGDAAVNGYMCNPYFAVTVAPGKQCITEITWSKDALKENHITEVTTLTLPIRVYETDGYLHGHIVNETFTVKP